MRTRLSGLREHPWTPLERSILIAVIAIVMGTLFVASYSLALGDPVHVHLGRARAALTAGHRRRRL